MEVVVRVVIVLCRGCVDSDTEGDNGSVVLRVVPKAMHGGNRGQGPAGVGQESKR